MVCLLGRSGRTCSPQLEPIYFLPCPCCIICDPAGTPLAAPGNPRRARSRPALENFLRSDCLTVSAPDRLAVCQSEDWDEGPGKCSRKNIRSTSAFSASTTIVPPRFARLTRTVVLRFSKGIHGASGTKRYRARPRQYGVARPLGAKETGAPSPRPRARPRLRGGAWNWPTPTSNAAIGKTAWPPTRN